jgi:hypothetical protein
MGTIRTSLFGFGPQLICRTDANQQKPLFVI